MATTRLQSEPVSTPSATVGRSIAVVVAVVLSATPAAHAIAADRLTKPVSGTFTLESDPGSWVGQGRSYRFRARAIEFSPTDRNGILVVVDTDNYWRATFSPPEGARLAKGVYTDARAVADNIHPGLDVSGRGHSCGQLTGSFRVLDIDYGPHGYLRSFHLRFEQHCYGRAAAVRGEIKIAGPKPPAPVEFDLTFDMSGTSYDPYDRTIKLRGTVICSTPAYASVTADVRELETQLAAEGRGSIGMSCSREPTAWRVSAISSNGIAFTEDALRVTVQGQAQDDWYADYTGENIVASEVIADVRVELPSRSDSVGFSVIAENAAWIALVALSIAAVTPWGVLILRRLRRRASGS